MKKNNNPRLCRLCASEENSFNTFSDIFCDNPELEVDMKITKLLPVVVMRWDPMPHTVCHSCVSKLNTFNDFYETSLKADRFFRSFHAAAPHADNLDPVVTVMGDALKIPPKPCQEVGGPARLPEPGREFTEVPDETVDGEQLPKKLSESFVVNQITTMDSIFTCRKCCLTFTEQSSAMVHSCAVGGPTPGEDEGKSLPPLKIRLFSLKSGLFVCYLCQAGFKKKKDLMVHLKVHIFEPGHDDGGPRKCKKKCKRGGCYEEDDEEDDAPKKKPGQRRRKKNSTTTTSSPPKKRGRKRKSEESGECDHCGKVRAEDPGTSSKETAEQMTQYAEVASSSQTMKDEELEIIEEPPDRVTQKEPRHTGGRPSVFEPNPDSDESVEVTRDAVESWDVPAEDPNKSDEVTVLEVISNPNKAATFPSCGYCNKVFSMRAALYAHEKIHLRDLDGGEESPDGADKDPTTTYLCCVCAMMFTSRRALAEHEQLHEWEPGQRKIRISLSPERDLNQCQVSNGGGFITITVTSRDNKIPQIEFL